MAVERLKGKKVISNWSVIGVFPTKNGRHTIHLRDMKSPDTAPVVVSVFQQDPPKCIQFDGTILVLNDVDAKVKVTNTEGIESEETRRNITGAILEAKDPVAAVAI